jgi:hypothetical protein
MTQNRTCDLCGLDVGIKPFYLESAGRRLQFCCEGCLGIYQMLHENELPVKTATPALPDDAQSSKGELP